MERTSTHSLQKRIIEQNPALDLQEIQAADWDFAGSDTQYSTHGMHTWLAAMIPALASKLIKITRAQSVLDPFCGGGTVLVEAVLAGIPTAGIDINPLATLISRAKTTHIEKVDLENSLAQILKTSNDYPRHIVAFPKEYNVHYWYKPYMISELSALSIAVAKVEDTKIRNFFECVFSATARDVSLTHRNEIRLRKLEPDRLAKFNPNVTRRFVSRARDSILRVSKLPRNTDATVLDGYTANMPFKDDAFTTIICSPPYGDERNGVCYFQSVKNMLYWLGCPADKLKDRKSQTLGWLGSRKSVEPPPSRTLKETIETVKNKKSQLEALVFYYDYYLSLKEMARVINDKIVIVIGQRVLDKKIFDNSKITVELFDDVGVRLEQEFTRRLPSKRLPKLREFGGVINKEHILMFTVKNKRM